MGEKDHAVDDQQKWSFVGQKDNHFLYECNHCRQVFTREEAIKHGEECGMPVVFADDKPTRPQVPHYTKTELEPWDCIELWSHIWGDDAFFAGNVIKYLYRYKNKGGKCDLEKARDYIDELIRRNA